MSKLNNEKTRPPKWALRLLRWYCKSRALEIIEGDIYELFYKRIEKEGLHRARRMFGWDVMRFFRLKYIKRLKEINPLNNVSMFRNYFKTSFRSLYRNKFYSLINISGLSIALAACMLIGLYILNELSYDKFHPDADRIYRLVSGKSGSRTPTPLANQIKLDFPEIEEAVRLLGPWTSTFKVGDLVSRESKGFAADSTFYKVFSIEFLEGNPDKALVEPNSVVLTKYLAQKYFGNQSAYGQLISLDGVTSKVTGVIANPPKNTHLDYGFIQSLWDEPWITNGSWTSEEVFTYAKLVPGVSVSGLEAKFPKFRERHAGDEILKYSKYDSYDELLSNSDAPPTFSLVPITDLHLYYPSLALGSNGDINNVYIFSVVTVFILLITGINFINLSTARSASRLKEVGMRKVMGSIRRQLVGQFLVESMIISTLAMLLAVGIGTVFLDGFNNLANREFGLSDLFAAAILFRLFGLALIIGFLAGCYPALYLSGFKPIKALKGELRIGSSGVFLRKGLVAFQFSISIILIISTSVVFKQLGFINSQDMGFESDQVLLVKDGFRLSGNLESFENALKRNPNIEEVAYSHQFLSGQIIPASNYKTIGDNPRSANFNHFFVSSSYATTMSLELIEGRFYSDDLSIESESQNIVINETAAKWLGHDEVLGKKLDGGAYGVCTIIGVVEDFHFTTLKKAIRPMALHYLPNTGRILNDLWAANYISIRVVGNHKSAVKAVEEAWGLFVGDEPCDFVFLNDSFNQLYDEERRFGKLFTASSTLAITIACLGLFALAAFTLERRTKEIAIRKVLGASITNLGLLVIRDFTKLVLIGSVVAIPVGYFVMNGWLDDFAYQTSISVWTFVVPTLLVALIAWLTVGYQSAKATMRSPIDALRSE